MTYKFLGEDFEKKETVVSNEERINDLEIAVCELLEELANTEE